MKAQQTHPGMQAHEAPVCVHMVGMCTGWCCVDHMQLFMGLRTGQTPVNCCAVLINSRTPCCCCKQAPEHCNAAPHTPVG
jgi:hypothetical protein